MAILNRESTSFISNKYISQFVSPSGYRQVLGESETIDIANTSYVLPMLMNIGTNTALSHTWNPMSQEQGYSIQQQFAATYLITARYKFDVLEEGNLNYNIPGLSMQELQNKLVENAINTRLRQVVLHGVEANEGIITNATESNLTQNWSALDSGTLLKELLNNISKLMTSVQNRGNKIVVLCTQKLGNYLNTALINTSNFLTSGSTSTVTGALKQVISEATGKNVEVYYDNTLFEGSKEKMLLVVPKLENTMDAGDFSVGFDMGSDVGTLVASSSLINKNNPEIDGTFSGIASINTTAGILTRKECAILINKEF